MKSIAIIKATGRVIRLLELAKAPKTDIQSLRDATEKFSNKVAKSRKKAANQFRETVHSIPSAKAIEGKEHQASSSDSDDSTEVKLKRTQADRELEKQARIQERDARIQAEQTTADLIQTMRDNGLPETLIESTLKKVKIKHQEKTPPQNSEIADL
jgi:RNA polymerase-binding transcription factor DksA